MKRRKYKPTIEPAHQKMLAKINECKNEYISCLNAWYSAVQTGQTARSALMYNWVRLRYANWQTAIDMAGCLGYTKEQIQSMIEALGLIQNQPLEGAEKLFEEGGTNE